MLLGDRQMSVCPTPVADRRQRAGVTLLCRYLPHHVLTLPRLSPNVAEAEEGERCPIRVRVVLAIWSVAQDTLCRFPATAGLWHLLSTLHERCCHRHARLASGWLAGLCREGVEPS